MAADGLIMASCGYMYLIRKGGMCICAFCGKLTAHLGGDVQCNDNIPGIWKLFTTRG